jgi:serine/threonine-protein kinase HipA
MRCPGCYKPGTDQFCTRCRKKLFDGGKVPALLPFEAPKPANFAEYQQKTKRLSISGVQLKYSLRLENKELELTDRGGQYILKPIPPSTQLAFVGEAPENEHLTMQIAEQVFKMPTAVNALMQFKDGIPTYITRRFDVIPQTDQRYQQEDFAQLSGRTKKTHGENFKYDGTHEEIGLLIKKYIAASIPALEAYFKLVVFNYLFSNGDAHLKNFSIIRTPYGDYGLTPVYDLMCTVLHTAQESDTALDIYKGDMEDPFYQSHGFYGRPHFEELARRVAILPKRAAAIIDGLLSREDKVREMVNFSFLSQEAKEKYVHYYLDKKKRFTIK